MLAKDISADGCLTDWLTEAGTSVENPTLTLDNENVYNTMCNRNEPPISYNYISENWKKENVQYKNY